MNISELIKKLQGVKDKDVEEAFNEAVENAKGEGRGFSAFILATENQTSVCGAGAEILSLIAVTISELKEQGLKKEDALKAVELAYMSKKELKRTFKEKLKSQLAEILEEDDDNE